MDHSASGAKSMEQGPGKEIWHHLKNELECQAKEGKPYIVEKRRLKASLKTMWKVGRALMMVQEEIIGTETQESGSGDEGEGLVLKA